MKKLMRIILLAFLGLDLSTIGVLGDYDITTMHKFNTEESYLNGQVITRYLNTCTVTVHPQTNAIGLPYINMDSTLLNKTVVYPLKSPSLPPLKFPIKSKEWETQTSSDDVETLPNQPFQLIDYQKMLYRDEANPILTLLNESKVLLERNDFQGSGTLIEEYYIKNIQNVFLFVQIKKRDLEEGIFLLKLYYTDNNYNNNYDKVTIYSNGRMSVCFNNRGSSGLIRCKSYNLVTDEYLSASFYINLQGYFEVYDAISHEIHSTKESTHDLFSSFDQFYRNYSYTSIRSDSTETTKFSARAVQLPDVLFHEKSYFSPWLHIENGSTLFVASIRKSDAKLITSLKERGTGKTILLASEDSFEISNNIQRGIQESIVEKVHVIIPEGWTQEIQIQIKAKKDAYTIDIWQGGNLELYRIHNSSMCVKSNIKEIYNVVFKDQENIGNLTECFHGGIFNYMDQTCSCPPGFTGDTCEIACGRNFFGQKCSKMCSQSESQCRGIILCTPSYGCSCAPGFHGDQCLQECDEGTYGADCKQICGRCKGGCDKYTGHCREDCDSPYLTWPSCKHPRSYWKKSPLVEDSDYTSIKINLDFSLNIIKKSFDIIKFYLVQYKEESEILWNNCSYNQFRPLRTSFIVQNLRPGRRYSFRVLLVDETFSTNDPDMSKISIGMTKCSVSKINNYMNADKVTNSSIVLTWKKETTNKETTECPFSSYIVEIDEKLNDSIEKRKIFNITEHAVLVKSLSPGHQYDFKLRKNTVHGESDPVSNIRVITEGTADYSMSVAGVVSRIIGSDIYLQWFKIPFFKTYYIKYKLIRRISCSKVKIDSPLQVIATVATNYTLRLEPNAQYEIFIIIDQNQETSLQKFTQITDSKLPDIAPILLKNKFRATNESAQVYWTDPTKSCDHMNGFFQKYSIQLLDLYNTILKTYELVDRKQEITGLNSDTHYKLNIRYVNHVGESEICAEHNFTTKSTSFLTAQNLTAYKTSANLVGLRWNIPESNSTITSITVNIQSQAENKSLNITDLTGLQCKAWPSYVCYNITHLKQNTKYTVSVDIFSKEFPEGGSQKTIHVVTRETAPSSVNDIKVEDISKTNMTISWRIPTFLNGILRKFLIEVEHLSSFDESVCCQSITTITHVVKEEKEVYFHVIENIQSASSYQVTIRAFTKRLGSETSKIIDIAPSIIPIKQVPEIKVNDKKIDWEELKVTNNQSSENNELIIDYLIIVETNEKTNNTKDSPLLRKEMGSYLSNSWWLAHICGTSENCSVNIGTGEEMDSVYGEVSNKPLTPGRKYSLLLAQVNKYLSARSYTIARSKQFEIEVKPTVKTTENTLQSAPKYNPDEPFTSSISTEAIPDLVESTTQQADEMTQLDMTEINVNTQEDIINTDITDYDTHIDDPDSSL